MPGDCRGDGIVRTGGQAVIEGVMMRAIPGGAAVAVRAPDGTIRARMIRTRLLGQQGGLWSRPVLRGAANLLDTLRLGLEALSWSADMAESGDGNGKRQGGSFLTTALGILLAVVLFAWLPLRLAMLAAGGRHDLWINIFAGAIRVAAFFGYVAAISLAPAIRRVFTFHGAEHQTIHAWERGCGEDSLETAALAEAPLHPRCGTSFLLLVLLVSILFYALVDTAVAAMAGGTVEAHWRVLYHLPLLPLVMGVGYEILKLVDRNLDRSPVARAAAAPGILLQRMTTRKAGPAEIAVAAAALRLAVGLDPGTGVSVSSEEGDDRPAGDR